MRYSQPFGTPQPPLGQYPRFVNGDPVTGTEGSIPPNTAFDEDQIEIVTVITNAGLVPDHADLTQLWQALQLMFSAKYITTQITKTVHGSGADFTDLHAALAWLDNYVITSSGYVTFMVAPGKWTYTASLEINHPNSNRVSIQGGALLGGTPQPGNISVTGYYSATDGTNQIIYLRSVHATELSFTGGVNGFYYRTPGTIIRYMLITGDQSQAATTPDGVMQGCGIYALKDVVLDGCSFWGWGTAGLYLSNCALRLPTSLSLTVCFTNSGAAGGGSCIFANAAFISQAQGAWTILASGKFGGLSSYGSTLIFGLMCSKGHNASFQGGGIACLQGSHVSCQVGSEISYTNGNAVCAVGGADWLANGTNYHNNGGWAMAGWGNSTMWSDNSQFNNNSSGAINVSAAAYGEIIGSTGTIVTNPPANTMDHTGANVSF